MPLTFFFLIALRLFPFERVASVSLLTDESAATRHRLSGDKQRNPHCIRSSLTLCDLSASLTDLDQCYTADVLSTPPLGAASDLTEFPHASAKKFCPLKESECLFFFFFFLLHSGPPSYFR